MVPKATGTKKSTPRKTKTAAPVAKQKKSAFRLDTLIAILVLAALIGYTFYLNREKKNAEVEATPAGETVSFVFTEADGAPNSIEIKPAAGDAQRVKVARDAKNAWTLTLPIKTEANQGSAEAAASQVSALQIISTLPTDADPSIFGFDSPAYVITLGFARGNTHTLEIGDSTPTQSGYYTRLDKSKIFIVSMSGIDALTQLAAFPPYLNTPTPLPTETPDSSVTPTP